MVTSKGGLNRGAKINMDGVKMLLTLRNEVAPAGKQLTDPSKYIDLSYYEKATGGKCRPVMARLPPYAADVMPRKLGIR